MALVKSIVLAYCLFSFARSIISLVIGIRYIDTFCAFIRSNTYYKCYSHKGSYWFNSPSSYRRVYPPVHPYKLVLNPRYWTIFTPSDLFNVDPPKWLAEDFGIKTFKELKNAN